MRERERERERGEEREREREISPSHNMHESARCQTFEFGITLHNYYLFIMCY